MKKDPVTIVFDQTSCCVVFFFGYTRTTQIPATLNIKT